MEFAHAWALALLPIAALPWLRRRLPAFAWPGAAELIELADRRSQYLPQISKSLALIAAVLALAQPRWPLPGSPLETEGVAAILVVDVSGSMAERDFNWNDEKISRLDALKRSLKQFIDRRPQDRIGLVLFASLPETACPSTLDHAALLRILQSAEPRGIPTESETNIGDAIAWAVARFKNEHGHKLMIVCSDGEHNVPPPALTTRQAAQLVAAAGVPIFSIFTGASPSIGRAGMESLATMTAGRAFAADDAGSLERACEEVDRIGRESITDFRRQRFTESYPWLALGSVVLLSAAFWYERGPGLVLP